MMYTFENERCISIMISTTVNIEIALPHNDYYNGRWDDVALFDTEREDSVDVDFFPELDERSNIKTFLRKYITIVEEIDD